MCTVSYFPLEGGYVLTSNRDEDPGRRTLDPEIQILPGGVRVLAPRDMEKGGTWIALDETGRAVCLMNGAFGRHERTPPYRKSRGLLAFEAMEASDFELFSGQTNLRGIEPFTLLMVSPGRILKLVWDGNRRNYWKIPAGSPALWSSPTLYTGHQHAMKERYLKNAMLKEEITPEKILQLHGEGSDTPFILKGKQVCTVSITQLVCSGREVSMQYFNKVKDDDKVTRIHLAAV